MVTREAPGLFFYVNFAYNIHNKLLRHVLKREGINLSVIEFLLLWAIYDNKEITQYELSKVTGYTTARINQAVQSLADNGYLKKLPDYSSKVRLELTENGTGCIELLYGEILTYIKENTSEADYKNMMDFYEPLKKFCLSLAGNSKFRNL